MHGDLALAVVLASQGTAARAGHDAPAFAAAGLVARLAPGFDVDAWLRTSDDRIWLERDWSLLSGDTRWYVQSGSLHPTPAEGARPWRPAIADADARVRTALAASIVHARRDGHDSWAAFFQGALTATALDDLLLAPSTSEDARRLSGLVGASWCFGGMGSWNDVADDDAGLYDALVVALVAAVNA